MTPADAPPAPAVFLPWDTEFFGFRIGRVTPNRLTPAIVRELLAWSAAERLRCLYLFADPSCATTLSLAHEAGFRFIDFRLDFAIDLERVPAAPFPDDFRTADASDLPALESLSRSAHTDTRFFKDLNFPAARSAELYAEWIRRDLHTHRIFLLAADGAPVSYVTCQLDPAANTGRIGLIAVSAEARGHGCGRRLVRGALAWFKTSGCREVRVTTQASNLAAQRLYQSFGFKTAEATATYHRWF